MNNLPKARTADIIEQEAGDELLIYDLQTDKMYQLNETSKIVYLACGKLSFDELKRRHKFTADLIHLALAELSANNLLENYANDHFAGLSRREVLRRVGLSSLVALPLVAALIAPRAAQAVSLAANGQPCEINSNCQSTCCGATAFGAQNQFCVAVGSEATGSYCRNLCECQSFCCVANTCQPGNLGAGGGCVNSCQCASKSCNTNNNTCN